MASSSMNRNPPQSFLSTYAPRLRTYGNALLTPVIQPSLQIPSIRTTKRGTTAINYAEDGYEDEDFDDSEGPRRPTGLRSLRREDPSLTQGLQHTGAGKELYGPVDVQGIWRDWMGKTKRSITEKQHQIQSTLPLTLIPIRIDLDIPSFRPEAPLPTPVNARDFGIDEQLPAYKVPEAGPPFRLKDSFLWNLHEALITPDQFAKQLVDELDFPNDRKLNLINQITTQIRTQLEEYAGVALHPLFQSSSSNPAINDRGMPNAQSSAPSAAASPMPNGTSSNQQTNNNAPISDLPNGQPTEPTDNNSVSASAEQLASLEADAIHNPDDTYRCIVNLNISLMNRLYSDRFEWSLLHPPGLAEEFARQTCADLGLAGEWVSAVAHALYEAVLRLKKEVCENGGLLLTYGEINNDAAHGGEAGWRYEPEHLADDWEPKVEVLSKEEIEKREGDRERQLRRVRRDVAKVSTTTSMLTGGGATAQPGNNYFAVQEDSQDTPMGRGERSKKKRRFRSLSPVGRDTPDSGVAGYGGITALTDSERQSWRCAHCKVWGAAVWAVRDGPRGKGKLCHNCGFLYERDRQLPPWSKDLFAHETSHVSLRR